MSHEYINVSIGILIWHWFSWKRAWHIVCIKIWGHRLCSVEFIWFYFQTRMRSGRVFEDGGHGFTPHSHASFIVNK